MKLGATALCILILSQATCAASQDHDLLGHLESRWETAIREIDLPGVSIAIVRGDEIIYANGFGARKLNPSLAFNENTSTYIASITKTFVGTAIMTLVEDGKFDLDAPVQRYLPRFQIRDADLSESITIRDLLCHRYGLNNPIITFAEAYSGVWDDEFYFEQMKRTGARRKWSYSNLHFTILGRVIQAATGKPWQDYLDERLFQPLNMKHSTAYASRVDAFDNAAYPLERIDGTWTHGRMRKSDQTMHAAGGIYTTARELANWIHLFINEGQFDGKQVLAKSTVQQMLTPQVQPGTRFFEFTRDEMGLAWYLGGYKNELLVHHFGGYTGFHAHASFMPEHDLGVVVLANSGDAGAMLVHQMAADVYNAFLDLPGEDNLPKVIEQVTKIEKRNAQRQAVIGPLPSAPLTLSQPLDAYTGAYTSDKWGAFQIRRKGDTLVGNIGNIPVTLHADKEDKLILWYPMGLEILRFKVDSNGAIKEARISSYSGYTMRYVKTTS